MIRRVQLENWRAYTQLDVSLHRPVTFVVAQNGVGKTSLVEAVRWALLGTPAGAPADRARGRAVRAGADSARVTAWVALPDHDELEVSRTLRRNGAVTFEAKINDRVLPEPAYLALLSSAWSAQPDLLDAVIFGLDSAPKTTGFPVRDHLATIFGVRPLLRAADDVKTRRDAIAAQIKSLRDDLSGTADAVAAAQSAIEQLEAEIVQANSQRAEAQHRLEDLERHAARARAWERYRSRASEYRSRTRTLLEQVGAALDQPNADWSADPSAGLAVARQQTTDAAEAAAAAAAAAAVDAARSATASELLTRDTTNDVCPTCLRPLTADERAAALTGHGRVSERAVVEHTHYEQQSAAARAQLAVIARFSDAFSALHPPEEPSEPDPGPGSIDQGDVDRVRGEVDEHAQAHGALRERVRAAREHLESLELAAQDQQRLTLLGRQDLLLEVTHRTLTITADRYLTERVEPLALEISHRWKLMFGGQGLHFAPDGQITLGHPELDLSLADLSGAERATALLISRLMLAASATKASTLWLDEPLEHLDPLRRAGIAQTLVRAAQTRAVDQIVVTTYEEGLARRLQATAPDAVQITYVRTTSDTLTNG